MLGLYPEIEPYVQGMLPVGDGNEIYWEECGDPEGKPVIFLHGGPGSGSIPRHRRLFDPDRYRIVLFDQRGCGRSTPNCATPEADLSVNTTWHLVADIERLREHLDIEHWMVFGGSWGSVLGLTYAETHPGRVTELVLRGVATLRVKELQWLFGGGAAFLFPEAWSRFLAPVPFSRRQDNLIEVYHELLHHPDPSVHGPAAIAWSRWEGETVKLRPQADVIDAFGDPSFALAIARIENHYFRHGGWLAEDQLLRGAGKLRGVPCVLVQGRYDVVTPAITAWELSQVLPGAELVMVGDSGHAFDEPGTLHELISATDRFASDWRGAGTPQDEERNPDMLFGDEHVRRYEETDGEVGHDWEKGAPCLVLTTKGRKTGEDRKFALIYQFDDDNNPVIVASKGGAPEDPGWYKNLQANPEVKAQVKADKFTARARTIEGEERAKLWEKLAAVWPDYNEYAKKTDREIPVVVLERV
ncbi:prolyl aminopeptidase [Amycolatopsis sp. BJA-103]|uniref:prolyl aminopeptidase n=1 Tax=Amycolatopsis sp. BJA-103 TaxID=1911175 RepID=UPI000C758DEC|nr:prolyl aminopeptidase [Amycolatopsis sp. BJA-103]AUI56947.1 prolyl aminopeptidase [Amycolatopsis sp. BJA-103]PNE13384.1 prolyl aminopeptidase [Amycolatopsis sp. BJA-103]